MTTGNSSPLALCTVITRTPSVPSSTIGASSASPVSASASMCSTKARNDDAHALEAPRQVDQPQAVGEGLLASRPERDAGMRAHRVEQHRDGLGNRAVVTPDVKPRQQSQAHRRPHAQRDQADSRSTACIGCSRRICSAPSGSRYCRKARSASSPRAKSGPRRVAKTLSSSSGHSIAASALRSAMISSRSWNERPPTSTWGMRRASSART